jgi:hypothetical protein
LQFLLQDPSSLRSSEDLAEAAVKNKNGGCTVTLIDADDLLAAVSERIN